MRISEGGLKFYYNELQFSKMNIYKSCLCVNLFFIGLKLVSSCCLPQQLYTDQRFYEVAWLEFDGSRSIFDYWNFLIRIILKRIFTTVVTKHKNVLSIKFIRHSSYFRKGLKDFRRICQCYCMQQHFTDCNCLKV